MNMSFVFGWVFQQDTYSWYQLKHAWIYVSSKLFTAFITKYLLSNSDQFYEEILSRPHCTLAFIAGENACGSAKVPQSGQMSDWVRIGWLGGGLKGNLDDL